MSRATKAPIGASLVIVSSFFYASYGIWTKLMGDFFQGYTASAMRSVLVVLMLLPVALFYRQLQPLDLKHNSRYIAGTLIAGLFTWGPLYYAINHAGVGISLAVTYASIVIGGFVFGSWFAQEKFTKDKLVAAVLGFVGIGLIFIPTLDGTAWIALIGAVVSGFSASANAVFSKLMTYNATQTTVVLWIASVIANVLMALVLQETIPAIGWHIEYLYIVIFAVASIIASWSLVKGVKMIDVGAAGVLGLLEIVFGVLFGVALFHERPGIIALLGVAIIVAAAAIPYVLEYRKQHKTVIV